MTRQQATTSGAPAGAGRARLTGKGAGRPGRGRRAAVAPAVAAAALSACALSACGGHASATIKASNSSGATGMLLSLSGNAGSGCVVDKNWFGFKFSRYGRATSGPWAQMATSILANGTWSAKFEVPSYLGGPKASNVPGTAVTPGRYEFSAPNCKGGLVAKTTFTVKASSAGGGSSYVGIAATTDGAGYWLLQANGAVHSFGDAHSYGSLPSTATKNTATVAIARTYDNRGYWVACANGHVYNLGDAHNYGSLTVNARSTGPVTSLTATPDGKGYWLLTANGHVSGFGDAKVAGMPKDTLAPFDAIAARPGGGYVVTTADTGAVYVYPGGHLVSGGPGAAQAASLVGTAVSPSGNGTWQAGADGGIFTWGDAGFFGSVPGGTTPAKSPVTAIAATPDGKGYWMVGANGSMFTFGDAKTFS